MPTGFTDIIDQNPDTTFREFALRCCRGMGVCMRMREDSLDIPPPETVEPDPYHQGKASEARAKLERLGNLTAADKAKRCAEYNTTQQQQYLDYAGQFDRVRGRYFAMLAKVKEWSPPTPEHQGLQKFMVEQLILGGSLGHDYGVPVPKIHTPDEWYGEAMTDAQRDVAYHEEHWAIEQTRCAEATAWLQTLYASLPKDE